MITRPLRSAGAEAAGQHPEIAEMDLNPLTVLERGRGCLVLDARIAVRGAELPIS